MKWENREYCQRKHGTSWAIVQDLCERERAFSAAHIETELIDETETIWFHGIHCENKGHSLLPLSCMDGYDGYKIITPCYVNSTPPTT